MYATWLLARAHGTPCAGDDSCFYCGAPAGESHPLELRSSFADWWHVANPKSQVICNGCDIALREKVPMEGRDKLQKTRSYSWLVTTTDATPYTKADKAVLLRHCLAPPDPPWALAIADSGQKHLLYRTRANCDRSPWVVQFETAEVVYTVPQLVSRVGLATVVTNALSKRALDQPLDANYAVRLAAFYEDSPELCRQAMEWFALRDEPLSRLAAFLCPPRGDNDGST